MSMPKGHKVRHGYATVASNLDGLGYREIAERMTSDGNKMNHSTARNVFLSAMSKFAIELFEIYNITPTHDKIKKVSSDPRFQSGIMSTISNLENDTQLPDKHKTKLN
jgi:hypothetical protein